MTDGTLDTLDSLDSAYDRIEQRQRELEKSANAFATTMTGAFARSVTSGKSFDATLKTITMSLSNMALRMAIKPIASALTSNLGNLLGNMFDGVSLQAAAGAVKPFASGGVIGTQIAASAAPDGYTLLFGTSSGLVINPLLMGKLPYDAVKDFAPVTLLTTNANMLVVNASLPAGSVKELIALAKTQPGKLAYATAGEGSPSHLVMELFLSLHGPTQPVPNLGQLSCAKTTRCFFHGHQVSKATLPQTLV